MRKRWVLLFATFVVVSGCAAHARDPVSQPAASSPPPEVPKVAAASPPPPSSEVGAPGLQKQLAAGTWCRADQPWPQREQALIAALPAILGEQTASQVGQQWAAELATTMAGAAWSEPCLRVEALKEYDALLISTRMLNGGGAVFADHSGGQWTVMPVQPPAPDWGMVEVLYFGAARPGAEGADLIFVGGVSGSSGVKSLWRGRPSGSGSLTLTPASQGYWKTGFRFLSADYVVATQRAEELGPVLETCNACQPTKQSLLKWSGDTYAEVASRAVSTPYMAANLFLGAIQAGDSTKALRYAGDRSVVEKVRIPADRLHNLSRSACDGIDEIEFDNWDRMPAEFRKSLPPGLKTCAIKVGDAFTLQMRRDPEGWVVANVTP